MSWRLPSPALALAALLACGGERWVIGEAEDAGADAAVTVDAAVSVGCTMAETEGIPLASSAPSLAQGHLGSWSATLAGVEAEAFPSARLQLQLAREAATLRFESASPIPALVDPAAGYLCTSSVASCASAAGFVAGFDYRLVEASSRGSILSFGVFLDEPWNEWCRQQTPVEHGQPGCEPRYAVERAYDEARWAEACAVRRGSEWTPIGCDRLATVERQVCACTADSCRARARLQPVFLRLVQASSLEGALWFTAERAQGLRFTRGE